jgi:hypothetical protein
MLARLFGNIHSRSFFLIFIYLVVMLAAHLALYGMPDFQVIGALGTANLSTAVGVSILLFIFLITAISAQRLVTDVYKLVNRNVYVVLVFTPLYLVLLQKFGLSFCILTALLWLIIKLWLDSFHGSGLLQKALSVGIIIGIVSLFDAIFIWLLAATWLVYLVFARLNIRTFLIPVVGFLTVWLNVWGFEYVIADTQMAYNFFVMGIQENELATTHNFKSPIFIAFGVLFVFSFAEFITAVTRANVLKRQTYAAMLMLYLVSVMMVPFNKFDMLWPALALPAISILFANRVQYIKRKWLQEFWLWAIMAYWIAAGYFGL